MMELEGASSSSSKPMVPITSTPSPRDMVLAVTTVAILYVRYPKALRLCSGGSFSVADMANELNATNTADDGDFYVNFLFLCHESWFESCLERIEKSTR